MRMQPQRFFCHTANIRRRIGRAVVKGDPAYGSPEPFKCRIEKASALAKDSTGEAVGADYVLQATTPITTEDKVWFPSIAGEPADDVSNVRGGRTVMSVAVATDRLGGQPIWLAYF